MRTFGDGFVWRPSQGLGETRTERGHRSRFLVVPNEDLPFDKIFDDDAGVFRWWADYFAVRYPKRLASTVAIPDCVSHLARRQMNFHGERTEHLAFEPSD